MPDVTEQQVIMASVDIAGFAKATRAIGDVELFELLEAYYQLVGDGVARAGGRVIKFMGDGALVTFPVDAPAAAVEALRVVKREVEAWLGEHPMGEWVAVRAHLGSVACGELGTADERRHDIIGHAVVELFRMRYAGFELSAALQEALDAAGG
jgi:adenylate cyclase